MRARHHATRARGRLSAVMMACQTALLLALWGGRAQAVTLEEPGAMRTPALCAMAPEALPEQEGLLAREVLSRVVLTDPLPPTAREEVPTWGEPDLSEEAILRLTRPAARCKVSGPEPVSAGTDRRVPDGVMVVRGPAARAAEPSGKASVAEKAKPATQLRAYVPPRRVPRAERPQGRRIRLAWWHALPVAPGLLALVASVRGLTNLRRRERYALAEC